LQIILYKDEDNNKKVKALRMKKIIVIEKTITTDKHKTIPNDFIQRERLN
jgi:hypothetical protein